MMILRNILISLAFTIAISGCSTTSPSNIRVQAYLQGYKDSLHYINQNQEEHPEFLIACSDGEMKELKEFLDEVELQFITNKMDIESGPTSLVDKKTGKKAFVLAITGMWDENGQQCVAIGRIYDYVDSRTTVYVYEQSITGWIYRGSHKLETYIPEPVSWPEI